MGGTMRWISYWHSYGKPLHHDMMMEIVVRLLVLVLEIYFFVDDGYHKTGGR